MRLTFGPGVLTVAAFIGPGTVTACTLAGAEFGFALIWTLVFATLATMILQDMTARLGAGAQTGLGQALMQDMQGRLGKAGFGLLIFGALFIGNSAYEGGNLTGAALGLDAIFAGQGPGQGGWVLLVALLSGLVVLVGRYAVLEKILIGLVVIMSASFLISAAVIRPDPGLFLSGLQPRLPAGATLTAMALIGTTIVPYNLFLHAAAAKQKWPGEGGVRQARQDSALSIGLGGLLSILILSTAATALFGRELSVRSAADMALAIEPVFGVSARYLLGIGLFAAGLTSAITAPMATAFAMSEVLGVGAARQRLAFRATALSVVLIGAVIGLSGIRPVHLILIAQIANGLLLPIIAVFLLRLMNRATVLGAHRNRWRANLAGVGVILLTVGLGARSVLSAVGIV